MKRFLLAAGIASIAAAGGVASAADLGPQPYYSAPSPSAPRVFNWVGFYAGANIGYEWGSVANATPEPSGVAGGVQGGYNWQSDQLVYGLEADINLTDANDTFAPYKFSNPWFGTVRGRIGYAFQNYSVMAFVTGGLAFGDLTATATATGIDESKTGVGWSIGAGAEYGFNANWSAKVEYLYIDLANRTFATTGVDNGFSASLLRFGVNYHF